MKQLTKGLITYFTCFACLIISIVISILYSKNHCQPNDDECDKKNNDYKITLIVFWVLFFIIPIIVTYHNKDLLIKNLWKKYAKGD